MPIQPFHAHWTTSTCMLMITYMYIIIYHTFIEYIIRCESFQVDRGPFSMKFIHSLIGFLSSTCIAHGMSMLFLSLCQTICKWYIIDVFSTCMGKCFCFDHNTFAFPTFKLRLVFCHIWLRLPFFGSHARLEFLLVLSVTFYTKYYMFFMKLTTCNTYEWTLFDSKIEI